MERWPASRVALFWYRSIFVVLVWWQWPWWDARSPWTWPRVAVCVLGTLAIWYDFKAGREYARHVKPTTR